MTLPPYSFASASAGTAAPPPGSLAELRLDDGTVMRSRLVVAADGPRSQLRDWAQLRTLSLQYGQSGLVATVVCDESDTAWQRFVRDGPIALLPVRCAGGRCLMVLL